MVSRKEEYRRVTLDHMVDERFAEIFFLAKEEYEIPSESACEQELYDMLEEYKRVLKEFCEKRR